MNTYRIQLKHKEVLMCLAVLTLSCAHMEFLGLTVVAWKTLSKQVLLMNPHPQFVKLEKSLHPKSLRKTFKQKAAIVWHIPLHSWVKKLATTMCCRSSLWTLTWTPWSKETGSGRDRTDFPELLPKSGLRTSVPWLHPLLPCCQFPYFEPGDHPWTDEAWAECAKTTRYSDSQSTVSSSTNVDLIFLSVARTF